MPQDLFLKMKLDQPSPFKVPGREGCLLEIGYPTDGMNVMVQYPNLSSIELKVFQSSLLAYSYYESETIVPIAYWIFKFEKNTYVETTFNACFALEKPEYLAEIHSFLSEMNNAVSFFIFKGQIIKAMRTIGLHGEAIDMFQDTLRKQLAMNFTQEDFILTMKQMENVLSSEEIFNMGTIFTF